MRNQMRERIWRAAMLHGEKIVANTLRAALCVLSIAAISFAVQAASVSPASLGFDPARFGLPVYPNATVKLGSAASTRDFSGHTQHSVVLETPDAVAAVAAWYAAHWSGATLKSYPNAPVIMMAKEWGTTNISLSLSRSGAETEIRIVVPGAY
jgi:hypothetical protein